MSEPAEKTVPLSTLAPGQRGRVASISLPGSAKGRIMELGLTIGVTIELVRFAPLGDPIELKVRGGHLSIRKSEASEILVEKQ